MTWTLGQIKNWIRFNKFEARIEKNLRIRHGIQYIATLADFSPMTSKQEILPRMSCYQAEAKP
jgi:hypothetical protein